ncbi:MAG: nucleotidyltransferase domain-containing protein [Clostridiales bacterium]|nr:nucleotidyltransferase domain-containing protein [Clostridiales bacterium]
MHRKLLCRIVSNAYNLFQEEDRFLGNEIDLIRAYKKSTIEELNQVLYIHKIIIESNGKLSFDYLYGQYLALSKNCFISANLVRNIANSYEQDDYINCTHLVLNNNEFHWKHIFFLELIVNAIWQRKFNSMIIFRHSYFFNEQFESTKVIEELYRKMVEQTNYYLEKRKVFTIAEIKEHVSEFFREYKNKFAINEIYLFGSYAKKLNDEFSDVDLLIIFKCNQDFDALCSSIKEILKGKYDMVTDIVPAIENELTIFDSAAKSDGINICSIY